MATLNLTTIAEAYDVTGTKRVTTGIYTGPASYPNGATDGDSFTPGEVGLGVIDFLDFENPVDTSNPAVVRLVTYDTATQRVLWFINDFTQATNGTNLSTFSCRFRAYGR